MKLVLDSNVVVAAFASRGLCHELFELCLEDHHLVLSDFLLEECRRVLREKIGLPDETVSEIIDFLREEAEIVEPRDVAPDDLGDPDDRPVLGTALSAQVECLVTGDRDLLALETFRTIPIHSPRSFWEQLQG